MNQLAINHPSLAGRRVTVMGLGCHGGGVGAVRFLAGRGARVTLTDVAEADSLRASLDELSDVNFEAVHLGGHRAEDFRSAEFVVVNPAVRLDNPYVRLARDAGATITSEIELFLSHCPARVIGVTGTNGKSTTAAMIRDILMAMASGRTGWLGGNIGCSLLPDVDRIGSDDWVVLELSSFQLAWLSETARRPDVAVVTNYAPHHLDWHGDDCAYVAAKRNILADGGVGQVVIVGDASGAAVVAKGTVGAGVVVECCAGDHHAERDGYHNQRNAACAVAAAVAAGCSDGVAREAVERFAGLEHRLQTVGTFGGRIVINDSQATTPEATMQALATVDGRCWLLAGGEDKGVRYDALANAIVRRCCGAALFGQTGSAIADRVTAASGQFAQDVVPTLADGLDWCWERSQPGDTLLLSTACSSHDQYRDLAERADDFLAGINRLAAASAM